MKKYILLAALGLGIWGCTSKKEETPAPAPTSGIVLRIATKVAGADALLNRTNIITPTQDTVQLRALAFFISNVELQDATGATVWRETDSYHLAQYTADSAFVNLRLKNVPNNLSFNRIKFGIGVDSVANGSFSYVGKGDLTLGNGMDWDWATGWKFVLIEGIRRGPSGRGSVIYHLGFNRKYRSRTIELANPVVTAGRITANFTLNLDGIFSAPNLIPVGRINDEMGNSTTADSLADNFSSPQTLSWQGFTSNR